MTLSEHPANTSERTIESYKLSKAMRLALLWLLPARRPNSLGAWPNGPSTWTGLERRKLVVYDFRAGTGGRYLTDEGRRIATLIKESR